jgi:hypothetical protein
VDRELRTTVGLKKTTKDRLDRNRAPGQCYDGFICQLIDLWEQANEAGLVERHVLKQTRPVGFTESPEVETAVKKIQ